jgi:hypothetical protein
MLIIQKIEMRRDNIPTIFIDGNSTGLHRLIWDRKVTHVRVWWRAVLWDWFSSQIRGVNFQEMLAMVGGPNGTGRRKQT